MIDVQLVSDSFRVLPPEKSNALLRRTKRTDLPLKYGEARCAPGDRQRVSPATVVARLRVGEQPTRRVAFPIPHPDPLLTRLLRDECQAGSLRERAVPAFAPRWRERGGRLRGTLVLTRRSGQDAITVRAVEGTTHYQVASQARTLGPAERRLAIPVTVTPARCDPHAFAEAKKAFLFPVRMALNGERESRVIVVVPDQAAQATMLEYAVRSCGLA